MKTEIFKCHNCSNYTLEKICRVCGSKTITPKPAKYSPEDKYGYYRRLVRMENGEI